MAEERTGLHRHHQAKRHQSFSGEKLMEKAKKKLAGIKKRVPVVQKQLQQQQQQKPSTSASSSSKGATTEDANNEMKR
jgi:hypothetical protein